MFNRIKGTRDLNPKEYQIFEYIRKTFLFTSKSFNFNSIETPILEYANLYKRSVAGSDIVKKEMYEFIDKSDREIALRPEGTAGFVRALIENKWYATLKTTKFSYFGQMFRYEQPQKGRQRQFYQAGVESISSENNPYIDAELIIMADQILKMLGVSTTLKINSIGDEESRNKYQQVLKEYFSKYIDQLEDISKERLNNNVLRILDDKIESKKDFVKNAPKINKYLSEYSKNYFEKLTKILDSSNIKYQIDYSLVRGLDYYDEIVYEFVSNSKNSGSQSTLIGGGRYNSLISELEGPKLKAAGWGFGVDRIAEIILDENIDFENDDVEKVDIVIGSINEYNQNILFSISNELRKYGIKIDFIFEKTKSKKIFERAKKMNAKFVIFDDEINNKNNFIAKELSENDKCIFSYDEEGFVNLLEFLSFYELEALEQIDIEQERE
ncbi:Histidyl-tRNA synthetase [Mycoplasmopsis maculosa]|uniref:Histidine--tRNA ligase n=1 Tax=Mycoplasmopsis maculosa TaxID=114885 RepID=A0A449B418_9BACT|nr:histidine--tRNA ligase [Mycoplasmopsis maculosa]VEU75319.1 Histidyl-tRNA synthetase [Mycoplasmopsis maculosa]